MVEPVRGRRHGSCSALDAYSLDRALATDIRSSPTVASTLEARVRPGQYLKVDLMHPQQEPSSHAAQGWSLTRGLIIAAASSALLFSGLAPATATSSSDEPCNFCEPDPPPPTDGCGSLCEPPPPTDPTDEPDKDEWDGKKGKHGKGPNGDRPRGWDHRPSKPSWAKDAQRHERKAHSRSNGQSEKAKRQHRPGHQPEHRGAGYQSHR